MTNVSSKNARYENLINTLELNLEKFTLYFSSITMYLGDLDIYVDATSHVECIFFFIILYKLKG